MDTIRILIVEDDRDINNLITKYLSKEGYIVDSVFDGKDALEHLSAKEYQLVVLDLMLPKVDGYEVLRQIRGNGTVPILILSAKNEETDKILGLGLGADDYLTKPFSTGELLARVKAQLRRYLNFYQVDKSSEDCHELRFKDLLLNPETYEFRQGNETKFLTAKEFEILKLLMSNPKRVFTKSQIFSAVWHEDYLTDENTVMVHIRRLRTKIESDPSNPEYIQTVWGIGYKLAEV